jgi:hypothetical protein
MEGYALDVYMDILELLSAYEYVSDATMLLSVVMPINTV